MSLAADTTGAALPDMVTAALVASFGRGTGHGLLHLGASQIEATLPPVLAYWREFASRYVTALRLQPEPESAVEVPLPGEGELDSLLLSIPPMTGAEYLDREVLGGLWRQLDAALRVEQKEAHCGLEEFLRRRNPAWNLVGRVHFNLAENRQDPEAPFAFLATYTTHLQGHGKAQHAVLGHALREYASAARKDRLLSLLQPVQRAAAACAWLREMVEQGEIYHPLRWTPAEAMQLLRDVPKLEEAGVIVRMPAQWSGNRPPRPRVASTVGARPPSGVGQEALLDFQMEVSLDGEPLSDEELRALLAQSDGLVLVRGRWVELDRKRLSSAMERMKEAAREAARQGLPFAEAMRLLAGLGGTGEAIAEPDAVWMGVNAGPWLQQVLQDLRAPGASARSDPGPALRATLRPYQQAGVHWLHQLTRLGLGGCLADDMGLGKTIQVLSLLLVLQREEAGKRRPSLLVAPASLLANWASEVERFAPGLRALVAHPSAMTATEWKKLDAARLENADLVITSYGSLLRAPVLAEASWRLAVLDEAQAIKNPDSKQTRAAKKLNASVRIALTGTPVENRLGDLWSIFDFINPGLLGNGKAFTKLSKAMAGSGRGFAPLRELVRPYILRRLKTDKSVIADLPEKTEMKAFCGLTRRQAALYQDAVEGLASEIASSTGIGRKGVVLSYLMRFKQICNHPSHWLADGKWDEAGSGKWARLREIAEVVASRQEKMLVFTQFREVTGPLAAFLESIFGAPGLVLHGGTDVKQRKELVRRFQEDDGTGFFVLSLKAGGAGLNLTAASHVVHFDRWWNPAVENQATDRAFRIGQKKNVLVHKFVCRGTVEEKIDALIASKRKLQQELLEDAAGVLLTEMNDAELLQLVALDLHKAMEAV